MSANLYHPDLPSIFKAAVRSNTKCSGKYWMNDNDIRRQWSVPQWDKFLESRSRSLREYEQKMADQFLDHTRPDLFDPAEYHKRYGSKLECHEFINNEVRSAKKRRRLLNQVGMDDLYVKMVSERGEESCAVCYEPLTGEVVKTDCNHVRHSSSRPRPAASPFSPHAAPESAHPRPACLAAPHRCTTLDA
jgi:hypothetical protein